MSENISTVEKIRQLKQLKDENIITEEEFNNEKSNIFNNTEDTKKVKENTDKKSKRAIVGFILGLCSIVAWTIPLFGFPVTIIGIVFSAGGLDSSNAKEARIGLILSIIFLVITFINFIVGFMMGMAEGL